MFYKGFNQVELKKITEILDRHQVQYNISVPDEALAYINDTSKRVNHRFMESAVQIEIDNSEFSKIPQNDIEKLFDLRIYPEMESPFTEEELANAGTETTITPGKKTNPEHATMNKWATIVGVGFVLVFALWRSGIFR